MYTMYMSQALAPTYRTVADARAHIKDVLDGAERGDVVTIERGLHRSAVVDAALLRTALAQSITAHVRVGSEDGRWFAYLDGQPFASDGATLDEALTDLRESLREYAIDWHDHLRTAPNHSSNRALVTLIDLSDDEELAQWISTE